MRGGRAGGEREKISFSLSPSLSSHPPFLSNSLSLPPFSGGGSRSSLELRLPPTGLSNFLVISHPPPPPAPFTFFSTLCHELDRQTQGRLCFRPLGMAVRLLGPGRGGSAGEKGRVIEKELQEGGEGGPPSAAGRARCRAALSCARDGPEPALRPRLVQRRRPPGARCSGRPLKS